MFTPKQKHKKYSTAIWTVAIFISGLFSLTHISLAKADDCKVACDDKCAYLVDPTQNQSCQDQCKADEQTCEKLTSQENTYNSLLKINIFDKKKQCPTAQIYNLSTLSEEEENRLNWIKK